MTPSFHENLYDDFQNLIQTYVFQDFCQDNKTSGKYSTHARVMPREKIFVFMNRWRILTLVAAVVLAGFLFAKDSLARLAWQKYGNAAVALALNRGDADLAIGALSVGGNLLR